MGSKGGESKFLRGLFLDGHVLLLFFHRDLHSFAYSFPFRVLDEVGQEEYGSASCALCMEVH